MSDNERIWGYEFEKDKLVQPGQLLLSEPFMFDENFRRTVVLICDHSIANGTVGLIVNKPVRLSLNEVVEDFPPFEGKLFLGGPVGTDTMQFLHTVGEELEGAVKISENLYWGGNYEQLRTMIELGKITPEQVHFFLGYSGWTAGQLLEEMQSNSWIITQATQQHIFNIHPDSLWKEVMKSMGGVYETMSGYPESPILN